jgi:hypothetical protein
MRRLLAIVPTCIVVAAAVAAPLSPAARIEIDGLMSTLESSGCEFNRNGTWYSGTDAKSHLLRKLKYLEDRGLVQSAEEFIVLAASASSVSGTPYLVRCGDGAAVRSGTWLLAQLQVARAAAPTRRSP